MCIRDSITMVARAASKNWKFCLDCENFLLFSVASLYKGLIRMYGVLLSYLGGGSGFTRLLDRVESTAKRLINCSALSSSLDPLSLQGNVGALSLSYRYRSGKCSRELVTRVPPPLRRLRSTIGAVS